MSDRDREREYSPSSCLPDGDYRPYVEAYRIESDRSRALVEQSDAAIRVVSYGDSESHTIDLALPSAADGGVPVVVFFHGGYWQELSKRDAFFPAWDAVQQGWAYAAVDYTLAPVATLDEIVDECRRAMAAIRSESDALGLDRSRIVVAGSSAGAHLAAMVALEPSAPDPPIAGAVLVSGVYDLEPLIGTSINDALGLDVSSALRNSPLFLDAHGFPPTTLVYGENETREFGAQTGSFERHLEGHGVEAFAVCLEDKNHFDVIMDLCRPGSALGSVVATMINAGEPHAQL